MVDQQWDASSASTQGTAEFGYVGAPAITTPSPELSVQSSSDSSSLDLVMAPTLTPGSIPPSALVEARGRELPVVPEDDLVIWAILVSLEGLDDLLE